ncbi:hypothetical protein SLS57_012150 [Botryosphaeria dothidea]
MRKQLISQKILMHQNFDTLVTYCRNVDREIRAIDERQQRIKDRQNRGFKIQGKQTTTRPALNLSKEDRNKHFPRRT